MTEKTKLACCSAGLLAAVFLAFAPAASAAEVPCDSGVKLQGEVVDTTDAIIPGATVRLDGRQVEHSTSSGHFTFPCVTRGRHSLEVSYPSFAPAQLKISLPLQGAGLTVKLIPEAVQTTVNVDTDSLQVADPNTAGPTQTIQGKQLEALADDPDELQQELEQLAAAAGGNPSNTTIAVDGFQDSSKLPPKSAIAYIKVNPDQFSAEYREPPFDGGRVEVYTKPGQKTYHGALFAFDNSPWMNATDPFAHSKAPLSKQRFGFELTGPIQRKGSDFMMDLEHRSINNYAVVNATTLDASGNPVATVANVTTPQRLWIGELKTDWQLGAKNTFTVGYSANVNHLQNVGVGGTTLAEAAYDSQTYEHMLRFTNVTTASAKLMHEARVSLRWDGETDTPNATAPQVSVAGAFTGGGAAIGNQRQRQFEIEADDDAVISTKHHLVKVGMQFFLYKQNERLTTNFNGTYTFGGGVAPVLDANGNATAQTETITGLEQYRRALKGLPGGEPTAFSNVAGTPVVKFTQVQDALYAQDEWSLRHGVKISSGVRYYLQNDPTTLGGITPRVGILWSPNKKGTWTVHGHVGMFLGRYGPGTWAQILRDNGRDRVISTLYSPTCAGAFNAGTCNPFLSATPIHTERTVSGGISSVFWSAENVGGTRVLPGGWNLSADLYIARIWNDARSLNINSPLNGQPGGPRPGPANTNILQVQNSGQGRADLEFVGLEQHKLKHLTMFFGAVHVDVIDDANDDELGSPQSSFTDAGEYARRTGQPSWNLFGNAMVTLPWKLQLSENFNAHGDSHYNITTGFDNNGDGNFNDRPQYARPGQAGAIQTKYGLLVASGGTGVFPRNVGVMPWTVYTDTNVKRTFALTRNPKAEHAQTLAVNVRATNSLNHTNVTSVGGVLGSPTFGVPYAADNGRRIEAGVRYSF